MLKDKRIAQYRITGVELGKTVTVTLELMNEAGHILGQHSIEVGLPASAIQDVRDAVSSELATFESRTGWSEYVVSEPEVVG